jgi:hypothetical protein
MLVEITPQVSQEIDERSGNTPIDRVLSTQETQEFLDFVNISHLKEELIQQDFIIKDLTAKNHGLKDTIKILEYVGEEREAKLRVLERSLEKLEREAVMLSMELEGLKSNG